MLLLAQNPIFGKEYFFCSINRLFFFGELKIIYTFAKNLVNTALKCPITVFILATLIISFLGSKDCLWLFEIQETNKTNIQS